MKPILVFLLFILFSCGEKEPVIIDNTDTADTVSVMPQASLTPDCGVSPYTLVGDAMFTDSTQWYECSIRFVKIAKEVEPEVISLDLVNGAIRNLNKAFFDAKISFKADEVVVIEDRKAYKEGIKFFDKHARTYSERGVISIFIYPSTIGSFSGLANGIPGTAMGIKEYYLNEEFLTVVHEMGHIFGLFHYHQYDNSGKKNSWENGDLVCGTHAADFFANSNNKGYLGRVTDQGTYIGPLGNMTQDEHNIALRNFMSYSQFRDRWNKEQIDRMHFIINNSQDLKETLTLKK